MRNVYVVNEVWRTMSGHLVIIVRNETMAADMNEVGVMGRNLESGEIEVVDHFHHLSARTDLTPADAVASWYQ